MLSLNQNVWYNNISYAMTFYQTSIIFLRYIMFHDIFYPCIILSPRFYVMITNHILTARILVLIRIWTKIIVIGKPKFCLCVFVCVCTWQIVVWIILLLPVHQKHSLRSKLVMLYISCKNFLHNQKMCSFIPISIRYYIDMSHPIYW